MESGIVPLISVNKNFSMIFDDRDQEKQDSIRKATNMSLTFKDWNIVYIEFYAFSVVCLHLDIVQYSTLDKLNYRFFLYEMCGYDVVVFRRRSRIATLGGGAQWKWEGRAVKKIYLSLWPWFISTSSYRTSKNKIREFFALLHLQNDTMLSCSVARSSKLAFWLALEVFDVLLFLSLASFCFLLSDEDEK